MSTTDRGTTPYVRATVLGSHRNADLALPTDQPVATLVPTLLDLLGEPPAFGRHEVVTAAGVVLDPEGSLADAAVLDGAELRLVTSGEAPPAPLVYDLVEVTEAASPRGRWTPSARRWVFSLVGALVLGAAALLATDPGPRDLVLWTAVGVAAVASAGLSRVAVEPAWSLGGLALGLYVGWLALAVEPAGPDAAWWGVAALLAVGVVGWCTGALLPAGLAAATLVGGGLLALVAQALTGRDVLTAGVTATAAVLLLGLVPRLALAASGVFSSDATVVRGGEVRVRDADTALARAHQGLTGGVVALAVVAGLAGHRLVTDSGLEVWPTTLAGLVCAAVVLRARHFPLAAQRAALWTSAAVVPVALATLLAADDPDLAWPVAAVLAAVGVGVVAAALVTPGEVLAARGRRVATRVEGLVVLALLPVLVGCFGVYGDLLDTFG
ncbi:type VII secretion integral membrane protein EccD [Nocardioides sp. CFH 31398]|uniref:type VII secretion integral membrane protein EccD n=1 Tax=Nocardioides sp. CFH 31398 TaxID=2919579 RepID=UPI001F0630CF|nr:type VII secretion integral membrane protein EccD [Nocardioides sp. CFH 31398]MCH1868177.1 type VII secretion integral membrane protein EccD [Nocardioides sp. CFH 31398]